MNKTFIVAAASAVTLVAAAGIVTPKFVAPEHQKQLSAFVDRINETPDYKAEILSTESSWFGSRNIISFGFDSSSLDSNLQHLDLETELEVETTYGPLLFSDQGIVGLYETKIIVAGDDLRKDLTWDEEAPFYSLSVVGDLSGGLNLADRMTDFINKDNLVTFSGYSGEGKLSATDLTYNGTMSSLVSESPFTPVVIEDITVTMDADIGLNKMMEGGFYNGKFEIKAAEIVVNSEATLTGLSQLVATSFDEENQLGTIQFGYNLKHFSVADFEGSDFVLMSELSQLSNQYFLDMTALLEKNKQADQQEILMLLASGIDVFFSTHPEFNITDFSGTFPEGSFNGSLTSQLVDVEDITAEDMMEEEFWIYNSIVDATIQADEALITDLGAKIFAYQVGSPESAEEFKPHVLQMINGLIQQGLIKQDNGKYFSNLSVQDGEGKINDVAFPL